MTLPSPFAQTSQPLHQRINILHYHLVHRQDPKTVMDYIKMFPVTKQYLIRYRTDGNRFATLIQTIIDKNSKQIVNECQRYLDLYSQGIKPLYSTDIDYLIEQLYK